MPGEDDQTHAALERAREEVRRAAAETAATLRRLYAVENELTAVLAASTSVGGPLATDVTAGSEEAKLIALNLALGGTPREQAADHLAEQFPTVDSGPLLDEVYASVQGA